MKQKLIILFCSFFLMLIFSVFFTYLFFNIKIFFKTKDEIFFENIFSFFRNYKHWFSSWLLIFSVEVIIFILFKCFITFNFLKKIISLSDRIFFKNNKSKYLEETQLKHFGSSRWLTQKEFDKFFPLWKLEIAKHGFIVATKIISKKEIQLNSKSSIHHLIIGATGSGKTQKIVIPTIIMNSFSKIKPLLLITDPKGELCKNYSFFLHNNNYIVYQLNLRNSILSNSWNPLTFILNIYKEYLFLKEIESEKAFLKEAEFNDSVNNLTESMFPSKESNEKDIFWIQSAIDVTRSIIFFMFEQLTLSKKNNLLRDKYFNLTNAALIAVNWRKYLKKISLFSDTSLAKNLALSALGGANDTNGSIMQYVNNSLRIFLNPLIRNISCKNEIDYNIFFDYKKPSAIFLIIPEENKNKNFFANLFINQIYNFALKKSSKYSDLILRKPFYFLLDEFANLPIINNFSEMITVSRSRGIFFQIIIQSLSQLRNKYGKDTSETIFNNCLMHSFLQTMDIETAKLYETIIGEQTILKKTITMNISEDNKNNVSITKNITSKKLITAAELLKLPKNKAIVILSKCNPGKVELLPFYKIKFYFEKLFLKKNYNNNNEVAKKKIDEFKDIYYFDFLS